MTKQQVGTIALTKHSNANTASKPNVFVSYGYHDSAFVHRLVKDLRKSLGAEAVWCDSLGGVYCGDAWWQKVGVKLQGEMPLLL